MFRLKYFCISALILFCTGQPILDCPKPVAYKHSAVLSCSKIGTNITIRNTVQDKGAICNDSSCFVNDERITARFRNDNTVLLTVQEITQEDEGEWTCISIKTARCSLSVFKLPSCVISSTESTNNLTIGQDFTLTITLSDYYCTNSIAWNLQIGGKFQNITEFRQHEEIDDITNKVVTYSPTVTSSLTGRVKLSFNCNDETYDVSCNGVKELKLRDPPSCSLLSYHDMGNLAVGDIVTLEATIEEYPCTTDIQYALYSGPSKIADFVQNGSIYHATFEVRVEYFDTLLHLKYTCNNVSATTWTDGVRIPLSKGVPAISSSNLAVVIGVAIGLPMGVLMLAGLFAAVVTLTLKHQTFSNNRAHCYQPTNFYTNTQVRYQDLILNDNISQEPRYVPDIEYETPQIRKERQNSADIEYETSQPRQGRHIIPDTEYEVPQPTKAHDDITSKPCPEIQYHNLKAIEHSQSSEGKQCIDEAQYRNINYLINKPGDQEFEGAIIERDVM